MSQKNDESKQVPVKANIKLQLSVIDILTNTVFLKNQILHSSKCCTDQNLVH